MAIADDANLMPAGDRVVQETASALEGVADPQHRRLRAALAGDETAMAGLYGEHAPGLAKRLRHLCGAEALAQDLVHDTFMVAFGGGSSFAGRGSEAAWLHGIAFNVWRASRRKWGRRKALLAQVPAPANSVPTADAGTVQADLQRQLDAALAELKPKLREAFVLRVIEQRSLAESAELAGCRVSTMSARARKAEAQVRAAFAHAQKDKS